MCLPLVQRFTAGFCPETNCCWYCVCSTCCVILGTLLVFSITCGSCMSMICSTTHSGIRSRGMLWTTSTISCVLICITSTISSTIHSEAGSCGITLTHAASESYRRSALLCVVNFGLLGHFICFFIRGLLAHIVHHVTLVLCKNWCSSLNSLSDGMDNFLWSCTLNRASSLCRSSP